MLCAHDYPQILSTHSKQVDYLVKDYFIPFCGSKTEIKTQK